MSTSTLQTNNPEASKNRVPWLASQRGMLAEDWEVVE
ncbi:Thoeris anti-defense Tad2 family protein [Clostridium sp. UBA1056]